MIGDRVQIFSSLMFEVKDEVLPVYMPVTNPDGSWLLAFDGSITLKKMGGVKTGSTGVIQGDPVRVHRSQLAHLQSQTTSLGGSNDFHTVLPVFLEAYQQVGWLPTDHVRVVSGARL